jgi:tetratricopeptide (TPR) repeat protein
VLGKTGAFVRLASLADKSLVHREPAGRFRLLDTVREYALGRLAAQPAELADAQFRHAVHYVELVEAANAELFGSGERDALIRLELEHGNLQAAFAFAIESGNAELAVRLAAASRQFWYVHGHFAEGLAAIEATLELAPGVEPRLQASILNGAGMLAAEQGDYEGAWKWWQECAGLARRLGEAGLLGCALANQGRLAWFDGDFEKARRLYEESLLTNPGEDRSVAISTGNLALIAAAQGDRERALELANETLAIVERTDSPRLLANARLTLGRVLLECGELELAAARLAEALAAKVELDDRAGLGETLDVVGELSAARGEGREAATIFGAASAVRAFFGVIQTPELEAGYQRYTALAREQAGEAAFRRAFAKGAELRVSEAVARGLATIPERETARA